MTLLEVIRDGLARVVAARSELADGANTTADMILEDLEIDLAGILARFDELEQAA
jgi:hypothetical protein